MQFSILAIIFVFGLLVFIHELGHFLAAKWMGVRVERFSIGFPPRLFGKKIGDTDYCVSAIPLGGYVKMSGMIDESMDENITGKDYEFNSKPVWKRIIIIIAGVVMNFFLAVVILSAVGYIKGERIYPSTEIWMVGKNGIAERVGFQKGDRITAINGVQINSWNEVLEQFFVNLNRDIDFEIVRNGNPQSLRYEKEWFQEKNAEILDIGWMPSSHLGRIIEDMPAEKAGLQRGDQIIKLDTINISNWEEMTNVIRAHPGDSLNITLIRQGEMRNIVVVPDSHEEKDSLGNITAVGKIGVEQFYEFNSVSLGQAIVSGFTGTINLIGMNVKALWWVISGTKPAKDVIGGPIMIAKLAGDAAAAGWDSLWNLIAALSAILAFFNILPIPALDGGHLMFLIYEGITRKPVSTRAKLLIQQVGMALLLTLIVFIIYIDLRRLFF